MPEEEEEAIFRSHGITAADMEPDMLRLARAQGGTEALHRAARVASVNQALKKEGHSPLTLARPQTLFGGLLVTTASSDDDDEARAARIIGLTKEEYAAIRGTHGTVMGLNLHAKAFKKLCGVCRGKRAMSLRGNPEAALKYLHRRIIAYAKKALCASSHFRACP